jgi:hypothetical protein
VRCRQVHFEADTGVQRDAVLRPVGAELVHIVKERVDLAQCGLTDHVSYLPGLPSPSATVLPPRLFI